MNFSTIYLLYPDNRALERAIEDSISLLTEKAAGESVPDTHVAIADRFRFTRGNHEQQSFNSKSFESLSDALQSALTHAADTAETTATKGNLGNILAAMGQQHRDAQLYERAIQCFNSALEELTREHSPLEWAATQQNLATANQALGRLVQSTAPLKIAVDAYTNALLVWTRDQFPVDWMRTMHQLGNTLYAYGKLLKGNRQFQKSVVAYKNALAVLDADNYPLELTATHNNRGVALQHLGESEDNPERLQEAIRAYEKALTVSMEQQLPIHVAVICRVNKATAQNVVAELTNDVALAEEVADEFEIIIECFSQALQPLCLKHCKAQMEKARVLAVETSASH